MVLSKILAVPVEVVHNVELLTLCIVRYNYPYYTKQGPKLRDRPVKYRTFRLNTGHLATLIYQLLITNKYEDV